MDDRELLELAAKAAGLIAVDGVYLIARDSSGEPHEWNPLTDDGDALRLAVKLRLNLDFGTHESRPYVCAHRNGIEMVRNPVSVCEDDYEDRSGNWYALTRRAIVRAAAEIGKEQSNES